jgi:hypothetical protein
MPCQRPSIFTPAGGDVGHTDAALNGGGDGSF